MRARAFTTTALLALALSAPVTPVAAQSGEAAGESDGFQDALDAALADYEGRRYEQAAAGFQAAFEIRAEPELMYNIARSYERALRREEAVTAYDRFLQLPGTTSEMRSRALTARNSLQAELAAMAGPAEPAPTEPVQAATTQESARRHGDASDDGGGGGGDLAPVGWVLVGLGVAAIAVGAVFGGVALASNDEFNATTDRDDQLRLQSEVRRYALLTDILIGTGAGVTIAGIVFLIVDLASTSSSTERAEQELELQPVVGPNLVGASLSGRF